MLCTLFSLNIREQTFQLSDHRNMDVLFSPIDLRFLALANFDCVHAFLPEIYPLPPRLVCLRLNDQQSLGSTLPPLRQNATWFAAAGILCCLGFRCSLNVLRLKIRNHTERLNPRYSTPPLLSAYVNRACSRALSI